MRSGFTRLRSRSTLFGSTMLRLYGGSIAATLGLAGGGHVLVRNA